MTSEPTLYERIGGRAVLERVHRIFYDKVYAHPWLGQFFEGVDQAHIERQQTDLTSQGMGLPGAFHGTYPVPGHQHMFITHELYRVRLALKDEALREAGILASLAEEWLAMDRSFEHMLTKDSPQECKKRFPQDQIIVIPRPERLVVTEFDHERPGVGEPCVARSIEDPAPRRSSEA